MLTSIATTNNLPNFKGLKNKDIKYEQYSKNFDSASVTKVIKQRVSYLPKFMNLMVASLIDYINGRVDLKRFSNDYLGWSVPFYKRINLGAQHESYCKNYEPEINLIKNVTKNCDEFINDKIGKEKFNKRIEQYLDKYGKTKITRKKIFIA